ncbi:MAG: hypothetical protein LAP21_21345 [Acidobacteriia bacterium]|nr:hypothetical protein [Terriglobia bacterium]
MNLPWIARRHYEEIKTLCGRLISDRDERIRQLEAERRMLWDKICLLGIGAPVFAAVAPVEEKEEASKSGPEAAPLMMRPSAIMRRMDRLAEERYLRKTHPSRANEEVVAMLDRIDREG